MKLIIKIIKKIIRKILHIIDIFFKFIIKILTDFKEKLMDLFLSSLGKRIKFLWKKSRIYQINIKNKIVHCPFCDSNDINIIHSWKISDHFGLFDDNVKRKEKIYLITPFFKKARKFLKNNRVSLLNSLSDISHIDYYKCNSCDLIYQNYPHTEQSASYYYEKLYRLTCSDQLDDGANIYGRNDERWVNKVGLIGKVFLEKTNLSKNSKILDLGCAEGVTCNYLASQGMESYGIEPSLPMVNYAKQVLKLDNIICDSYKTTSYPSDFFDGIISFHVAEHTVNLKSFFEAIKIQLKSNGYLLLMVPCVDNARTKEDFDNELLCGGHIYGFTEKFLHKILISNGFEILESLKTPCDLSVLDKSKLTPWGVTIWADKPGGLSILAKKQERV